MEDLNQLSNEDLKYRLTQFGFPNLPVTSTTRKVLIKKLRNHLENEKSKLKRDTSYATRYSSDEEHSDADTTTTTTTTTTRKRGAALSRATLPSHTQSGSNRPIDVNITMPPPSTNSPGLGLSATTKRTTTTNWEPSIRSSQYSLPPYSGSSPSKQKDLIYISPLIQSPERNGSESDEESDTNANNSSIGNRYMSNVSARASIGGASNSTIASGSNNSSVNNSMNGLGNFADLDNTHYLGYGGIRNRFYNPVLDEHDSTTHQAATTNGVHDQDDASNQTADFTKRLMSFRNRNLGTTVNNPTIDPGKLTLTG